MSMVAGANTALTKENPDLITVVASFGWNVRRLSTEFVAGAIVCGENKKAISPQSLIYFNQPLLEDETIEMVSEGNQEQVEVDIAFIPEKIHRIVFVVYVNPESRDQGSFAHMDNAFIEISKMDGSRLLHFNVPNETLNDTVNCVVFGELYRYQGDWKFRAIGQGYNSLDGVAKDYEVDL